MRTQIKRLPVVERMCVSCKNYFDVGFMCFIAGDCFCTSCAKKRYDQYVSQLPKPIINKKKCFVCGASFGSVGRDSLCFDCKSKYVYKTNVRNKSQVNLFENLGV